MHGVWLHHLISRANSESPSDLGGCSQTKHRFRSIQHVNFSEFLTFESQSYFLKNFVGILFVLEMITLINEIFDCLYIVQNMPDFIKPMNRNGMLISYLLSPSHKGKRTSILERQYIPRQITVKYGI